MTHPTPHAEPVQLVSRVVLYGNVLRLLVGAQFLFMCGCKPEIKSDNFNGDEISYLTGFGDGQHISHRIFRGEFTNEDQALAEAHRMRTNFLKHDSK